MNFLKKFRSPREEVKQLISQPEKLEPKHMHDWVLSNKTYAAPVGISIQDLDTKTIERLSMGVTTMLWECSKCAETKKEEMLGSDEDTMLELISKVKRTGPQYIERDGETYVFNKWSPPSMPSNVLPIRQ